MMTRCLRGLFRLLVLGALAAGSFHAGLQAQAPDNDSFAGRLPLLDQATLSSANATREPGEPNHLDQAVGASVWWTWTAPDNGSVTIDTTGSSYDTTLSVYTGSTLEQLTLVAADDDDAGLATSSVTFNAVAGRAYQIAVDGFQGATGDVTVHAQLNFTPKFPVIVQEPAPVTIVDGTITNVTFSVAATGSLPFTYVWYHNGASIPNATAASLTLTNPTPAEAGLYRVLITNPWGSAESPSVQLRIVSAEADDRFADRASLTGATVNTVGNNLAATAETGDPKPLGQTGGRSVWWSWTAPANGLVSIDTLGSTFDTVLGVYTGDTLGALVPVVEDDNSGLGRTSEVWFRATAGTAYQILVDGARDADGNVSIGDIALNLKQLPDNDFIANFRRLEGDVVTVRDSNVGATIEPGEPVHGRNASGHTIWFNWHANATGPARVDAHGSAMPVLLAVYDGPGLGALHRVAHHEDPNTPSLVRFEAVAGREYFLAADGYQGANATGAILINLDQTATSNDRFADRVPLDEESHLILGSNVDATHELGEPEHAENAGGSSVWWSWTAPYTAMVTIATTNSTFDTLLGVYTGDTLFDLTRVAENDDFDDLPQSLVRFQAVEGTEYQIAVDGYKGDGSADTGTISLSVMLEPPVIEGANDDFARRIALTGPKPEDSDVNTNATRENGEPDHAGRSAGHSLWWSWTATSNDPVTIDTDGSSFATVIAVYTGTALDDLTPVGGSPGANHFQRGRVSFFPVAGTEYLIAVDGQHDSTGPTTGTVKVTVKQHPAGYHPANDRIAQFAPIPFFADSVEGSNVGAGPEPREPGHVGIPPGSSVWWLWQPRIRGPVTFDTLGSSFDTVLAVYVGTNIDQLEYVTGNDDIAPGILASLVRFEADPNLDYAIMVEGYGTSIGEILLNFTPEADLDLPPAIVEAPAPQTRFLTGQGSATNVTFSVTATGAPPLLYQWQKDGIDIPGADTHALTLVNVGQSDAGQYRVRVSNTFGSILSPESHLEIISAEFNDDFAHRLALTGASADASGSVLGATREPVEPAHAGRPGSRSVWWTWTAPASGPVAIDTLGSGFDTTLAVYEGATLEALTEVTSDADIRPGQIAASFLKFDAVAGREYQIAVDSAKATGADGHVHLTLRQPPAAPSIVDPPHDVTVQPGETIALHVDAAGLTPDTHFQWFHGGESIAGVDAPDLTLRRAELADRGPYHVVITSEFGSAKSESASVWVRSRPPVAQVVRTAGVAANGAFRLEFSDADGTASSDSEAFVLQSTGALLDDATVWTTHDLKASAANGVLVFEDPDVMAQPQRIYRVLEK